MRSDLFREYTEDYKQLIKQFWWKMGRPATLQLVKKEGFPIDEHGRKPNAQIINRWKNNELWDFWADELDSRAMVVVENDLIAQKVEMLRRHANVGFVMIEKGLEHLASGTFDSSSAAVAAIKAGVEIERTSRGIGEMMMKMAKMDDGALKNEIMNYINRASENNQIVEADLVPEEKKEDNTEE